jgi:hypothetical protein
MSLAVAGRWFFSRALSGGDVMKRSSLEDMSVMEVLDRVLDNGIVVDPSARVYLIGRDLRASQRRMVVDSIRTHF